MRKRVRVLTGRKGRGAAVKTAAVMAALALMTGCQSKYKPVGAGESRTAETREQEQAETETSRASNMSVVFPETDAAPSGGPGAAQGSGTGAAQGPGSGTAQGSGDGTAQGSGMGTAQSSGSGTSQGPGTGAAQSSGGGTSQGAGNGTSQGPGAGTAQGSESGTPQGPGSGAPQGSGAGTAQGSGNGTAQGSGAGTPQSSGTETSAAETVYVKGTGVNIRSVPGTEGEIIAKAEPGMALKRVAIEGEWSKVIYQDRECYIKSEFLTAVKPEAPADPVRAEEGEVRLDPDWTYAGYSKINSGAAKMYKSTAASRYNIVVCVNAGHGTSGGGSVKTQCHPDGTPKVTGGSTAAGEISAAAVSSGMEFADGTPEAKVTLAMALKLRDKLLASGYDVLMIRETDDVQLDNVARTVIANNMADCHLALHWDSSTNDKGAFYCSVPNVASYRDMEPVKSHWQQHQALGESVIGGLKGAGVKIYANGSAPIDLTQTSYSTIPSIDIELGDKGSDHSDATLEKLAAGIVAGINAFYGK